MNRLYFHFDLRRLHKYNINEAQLDRFRKNDIVKTITLDRLCKILDCNIEDICESMTALKNMQNAIYGSNENIEGFIGVLRGCLGMERRLNKAISSLISELEEYLQMTDTMSSSVDRILSKGEIVIDTLKK